ncbi:MAG: apolipoprotein N-acyltransferase [Pseudomonadota bacterium]
MLQRLADLVIVQWGLRRLAIALIAGAVSALAMPPYDAVPVLLVTFPVLVWLIDGSVAAGRRAGLRAVLSAFTVGWAFGAGYFVVGLYWIGAAFLVEAETFAWMMPFAMAALPVGLGLFYGIATAIARSLWISGPWRVVSFATGLLAAELLRGTVLTGFPWNGFGYALTVTPVMMQSASLIGVYSLAFIAGLVFAAPAALAPVTRDNRSRFQALNRWMPLGLAAVLVAGIVVFGVLRLGQEPRPGTGVAIRIVQPSIAQTDKWRPEMRDDIFARYLALTDEATAPGSMGVRDAALVIWPESAMPFLYQTNAAAQTAIADLLPPGTSLITGLQTAERDEMVPRGFRTYNSVAVIEADGQIAATYDKVHLVPFGEFLPFQATLERLGIRQLTGVVGGFDRGDDRKVMTAGTAPSFLPLICYEIIFPGRVVPAGERPRWLLNVTNDAWFGDSPGPHQHLRQARVRAVEEGLPLVRAANTGISAIIDPHGKIVSQLPLNVSGVIDGELPSPLGDQTWAARFGMVIPIAILMAALGTSLLLRIVAVRHKIVSPVEKLLHFRDNFQLRTN